MSSLRTPDDRFVDLPDFPYPPAYLTLGDGLRMAYVEAGPPDAQTVVLLHGSRPGRSSTGRSFPCSPVPACASSRPT